MTMKRNEGHVRTRIRKNDLVQVIRGKGAAGRKRRIAPGEDAKDLAVRGRVLRVDRVRGRAIVQGAKLVYKHQRASRDPSKPNLGRIEKEAPIPLSNLMLVCPKCDQATRIGIRLVSREIPGKKAKMRRIRICKKCGAEIP